MVKPALAYLDVIAPCGTRTLVPLAAYNVSGEYSGEGRGRERLDRRGASSCARSSTRASRRAGADPVITYHGREALEKGLDPVQSELLERAQEGDARRRVEPRARLPRRRRRRRRSSPRPAGAARHPTPTAGATSTSSVRGGR
jgi:hypothetical protein